MRIYKTIKPTQTINCPVNKQTVMKYILAGTHWCTNKHVANGNIHIINGQIYVRAFNLVKHNRKVIRLGGNVYKKYGKHILKPMYWETFIYDIPVSMLEYMNLCLVQYERHFKIVELD